MQNFEKKHDDDQSSTLKSFAEQKGTATNQSATQSTVVVSFPKQYRLPFELVTTDLTHAVGVWGPLLFSFK